MQTTVAQAALPAGREPLAALAVVHVVAGAVAALLADGQPTFPTVVSFALTVCQAALIGMWGGLGRTHGLARLVGVGLAIALLGTVLGWSLDDVSATTYFFVFVATALTALATWIVRLAKARIGRLGEEGPSREGLQFTIKHLMLFTFAVACLVTIGKALAPLVAGIDLAAQVGVLAVCFVAVGLTCLWALLGLGRPWPRLLAVVLIAAGAGGVGGFVLPDPEVGLWVFIALAYAACLVGSLALVRMSGYRLLARR